LLDTTFIFFSFRFLLNRYAVATPVELTAPTRSPTVARQTGHMVSLVSAACARSACGRRAPCRSWRRRRKQVLTVGLEPRDGDSFGHLQALEDLAVSGSTRRISLLSASIVPCQSSPSTQETP